MSAIVFVMPSFMSIHYISLAIGHYLSPWEGGGEGSEDFGLNTVKFSRPPF